MSWQLTWEIRAERERERKATATAAVAATSHSLAVDTSLLDEMPDPLTNSPTDSSQIIPASQPLPSSSQSSVTGSGKKISRKQKLEESNLAMEKDFMTRLTKQGEDS